MANTETEKLDVDGVCTCGCDTWKWRLEEHEITFTCTKCGKQGHWYVPYPMMDMVADAT